MMTCSISEDYARIWLYFARATLRADQWDFVIVDSAGDMDPAKLQGSRVIRFLNLRHGTKVDVFARKVLQANVVFLCDDDMYLLRDVAEPLSCFDDPNTPIVSLYPRQWWRFHINGQQYPPMGSFAILFQRPFLLRHRLKFQSPDIVPAYGVVNPGLPQSLPGYDMADYMHEQLLLQGYRVAVLTDNTYVLGFKGLSDKRILLIRHGSGYVRQAIAEAVHYHEGSSNEANLLSFYAIVKVERLYRQLFDEDPTVRCGLEEDELRDLLRQNPRADAQEQQRILRHFDQMDETYEHLRQHAMNGST